MDNPNVVAIAKTIKSITTEKENLHESVPKGYVRLTQVIAYFDDKPAKKCFCETYAQQQVFRQNNPDTVKFESFNVALPRKTALEYLNKPANKKEFVER